MKRIPLVALAVLFTYAAAFACTVCAKQQPKIVRGITHGAGPQSDWDFVIVGGTALIVVISLFYSIKWIVKPGEQEHAHIKYSRFILE